MKGVVFTEFMELVEDKFSFELADQIIEASELESGGSYTSLGTYDHNELLQMVTHLSDFAGAPVPDLVRTFGLRLTGRFVEGFPQFFEGKDLFSFLESVEGYIHVEVRKLYPDAELPNFETERVDDDTLVMKYQSTRPFNELAHGLILGTIEHYGEPADVSFDDTSSDSDPGTAATFTIKKK